MTKLMSPLLIFTVILAINCSRPDLRIKLEQEAITTVFNKMQKALSEGDEIGCMKYYSKPFKEYFNNLTYEQRLEYLAAVRMNRIASAKNLKETITKIELSPDFKTATVSVQQEYIDPATNKKINRISPYPFVKEDDGWKVDVLSLFDQLKQKLKL